MLHFRAADHHIGDVHPYYKQGRLYLYYLVPNGVLRCDACFADSEKVVTRAGAMAITDDYDHWNTLPLAKIIVNIVRLDGRYYTCRSCDGDDSFLESSDLIHWEPSRRFRFMLDKKQFPGGARDFAVFYDEKQDALRLTALAYRTNEHNGIGQGLDCCVLITGPISDQDTCEQRPLVNFHNEDTPLLSSKEPECSQMMHIGNRWYLLTSLARQSVHWVGRPAYWIGESGAAIDDQDWNRKDIHYLDGEDLCAAQLAEDHGRIYLFGWIPLNYQGQEWGGDLNLPRIVEQLMDGTLCSHIDLDYAAKHTGPWTEFKLAAERTSQGWQATGSYSGQAFRMRTIFHTRPAACFGVWLNLDQGLAVVVEQGVPYIKIIRDYGKDNPFVYAQLPINENDIYDANLLDVFVDDDIVEVFINNLHGLCARVEQQTNNKTLGVFTSEMSEELTFYMSGLVVEKDI